MGSPSEAKSLFDTFKAKFEAEPCDLAKCEELLGQLKLLLFSGSAAVLSGTGGGADFVKEQLLVRETLELACFLSIRLRDLAGFERHVSQLKMFYDRQQELPPSEQKYPILGLSLLHLLASDRLGEFHTELELIPVDEAENMYIKQPVQLERYLMEGNYAKVLEAQKDVPKMYYAFFMERLIDTVRQKVGASLERSYETLPAQQAAQMLILADADERCARLETSLVQKSKDLEDELLRKRSLQQDLDLVTEALWEQRSMGKSVEQAMSPKASPLNGASRVSPSPASAATLRSPGSGSVPLRRLR